MTDKKTEKKKTEAKLTGLDLLRAPFEPHQIGKLPKPTKKQTEEVKKDYKVGIRCDECGQWHHPKVVHLDYVGHAALTDRFLDCDPAWDWDFLATNPDGLPIFSDGGLWIKLTICGQTRKGFGDAAGKSGPNAIKEIIGDALRNAGMRFGAALDLWHKGDLHDNSLEEDAPIVEKQIAKISTELRKQLVELTTHVQKQETTAGLKSIMAEYKGITDEIKKDFPFELRDDGKNLGFASIYKNKIAELKRKDEMDTQQTNEVSPDGVETQDAVEAEFVNPFQ